MVNPTKASPGPGFTEVAEASDVPKKRGRGRARYKQPDESKRIGIEDTVAFYVRQDSGAYAPHESQGERPVVWVQDPRDLMNVGEREYSKLLEADPEVKKWWFGLLAFRLGHNMSYLPDFLVLYRDGHIEAHEVKGGKHIEEDALVKMKAFVSIVPEIPLVIAMREKKGFKIERFPRGGAVVGFGGASRRNGDGEQGDSE